MNVMEHQTKEKDELYSVNVAKSEFWDCFNFSDLSRLLAISDPEFLSFPLAINSDRSVIAFANRLKFTSSRCRTSLGLQTSTHPQTVSQSCATHPNSQNLADCTPHTLPDMGSCKMATSLIFREWLFR